MGEGLSDSASIRKGSHLIGNAIALMQMVDGARGHHRAQGPRRRRLPDKHARIIRKLIPIRDAVREVL